MVSGAVVRAGSNLREDLVLNFLSLPLTPDKKAEDPEAEYGDDKLYIAG